MPERSRKHGGARHKSVRKSTARRLKMRQHNRSSREYTKSMMARPIAKFQNAKLQKQAANMKALMASMNRSHLSARSATRHRLLSQKRSQANPFALKKSKLSAVSELNGLFNQFEKLKTKLSYSVRKPRGNKNVSMASRSSARVAARQSQQ